MSFPKISIVTVCYNAVETIEKTILSVIRQSYGNIEYIIIDGASTDGTIEVINKYRDKLALFVSERDNGIYDAMNKSTNFVTGDWIIFLNSGDVLFNEVIIEKVVLDMQMDNSIYYGDVMLFPQNVRYGGFFNKWRLTYSNICHQSIFYPRSVFEKYKYNTNYHLYADWLLNVKCMGDKSLRFRYLDSIITLYDTTGVSSSKSDAFFYRYRFQIVYKYLGLPYLLYMSLRNLVHSVRMTDFQ